MRTTGFSFPCPCPAKSEDKAFERFIKTAQKDPSKIHNPFPLLAGYETFRQARTQPLINLGYLPTTDYYNYGSCLAEKLTLDHEYIHANRSLTPAKILANVNANVKGTHSGTV
jgi:hypothetical protein